MISPPGGSLHLIALLAYLALAMAMFWLVRRLHGDARFAVYSIKQPPGGAGAHHGG